MTTERERDRKNHKQEIKKYSSSYTVIYIDNNQQHIMFAFIEMCEALSYLLVSLMIWTFMLRMRRCVYVDCSVNIMSKNRKKRKVAEKERQSNRIHGSFWNRYNFLLSTIHIVYKTESFSTLSALSVYVCASVWLFISYSIRTQHERTYTFSELAEDSEETQNAIISHKNDVEKH